MLLHRLTIDEDSSITTKYLSKNGQKMWLIKTQYRKNIHQAKRHHNELVGAKSSDTSNLSLVPFLDSHLVVSMLQVRFGKTRLPETIESTFNTSYSRLYSPHKTKVNHYSSFKRSLTHQMVDERVICGLLEISPPTICIVWLST